MTGNEKRIAVGIVGFGKIARDRHVPALQHSSRSYLHSTADPLPGTAPVPHYADVEAMLAADDAPDAVAICTPPQHRSRIARTAIAHGCHVLLEKPPCATPAEVADLRATAASAGRTLFCAWHSRFAPAVEPARAWLARRDVRAVRIDWREDVRDWHPNQRWIWEPGGFGAFDPGINALSIVTTILPRPITVQDALLSVPGNCRTPATVELILADPAGADIRATFDFLEPGPPTWTIAIETDGGHLLLSAGGSRMAADGVDVPLGPNAEYETLYRHFEQLVATGDSDADATPLQLVCDAFALGRSVEIPALDASFGVSPPIGTC